MSLKQNDTYLENKRELFESALYEKNFELAEAVMYDLANDGFEHEALLWKKELRATLLGTPLSTFASPYA